MIALALFAAAAFEDLAALDARVTAYVGDAGIVQPIDRRLRLAACPEEPQLLRTGRALAILCNGAVPWNINVRVAWAATAPEMPLVRRRDPVLVVASGSGFAVTSAGVAEADARAGERVSVDLGGRRVVGILAQDGSVAIAN